MKIANKALHSDGKSPFIPAFILIHHLSKYTPCALQRIFIQAKSISYQQEMSGTSRAILKQQLCRVVQYRKTTLVMAGNVIDT